LSSVLRADHSIDNIYNFDIQHSSHSFIINNSSSHRINTYTEEIENAAVEWNVGGIGDEGGKTGKKGTLTNA